MSAEAFKLMWYACDCGHRERIWNSRDGVTPFCLGCPSCGELSLSHVEWSRDENAADHKPHAGQRFFRDGTKEEALEILDSRFKRWADKGRPVPAETQKLIRDLVGTNESDFRQGWPKIDRNEKDPKYENILRKGEVK